MLGGWQIKWLFIPLMQLLHDEMPKTLQKRSVVKLCLSLLPQCHK
jgi:hypothetical protein